MKIGIGYDVHKLTQGRKLILGGVKIPYDLGLDGHSDADVLTHAISDAILGAAKLGDIGKHFPDTDPQFKDANSLKLLEHVVGLVNNKYKIIDIDSVIVAQAPKLSAYREQMEKNLSKIVNTTVGVKATTTEGTGPEGRGETISAQAVCILEEKC
ncbi:MAG: 2-C-methyl-D-erythritol 2,4-cyclodiphosphate synthase [Coriobacteriia bacterium]|nr:2-C-methyl-D-erythritol 2,4-cyclodiphosphate synthase [Coriobacteriia bacterium]